jgi:hypothetical protein
MFRIRTAQAPLRPANISSRSHGIPNPLDTRQHSGHVANQPDEGFIQNPSVVDPIGAVQTPSLSPSQNAKNETSLEKTVAPCPHAPYLSTAQHLHRAVINSFCYSRYRQKTQHLWVTETRRQVQFCSRTPAINAKGSVIPALLVDTRTHTPTHTPTHTNKHS